MVRRPEVQPTVSYGQMMVSALLTGLMAVILGGGYWIATKDGNDTNLVAKLDAQAKVTADQNAGLQAQIANVAGKVDGFSAALNNVSGQVQLIQQRLTTAESDLKETRSDASTFQRATDQHLNEVDARTRVLEAYRK